MAKKEQHESNVNEASQVTSEKQKTKIQDKEKSIKNSPEPLQDKQKSIENSPEPETPQDHSSPKKIGSVKSVDGTSDSNYARI